MKILALLQTLMICCALPVGAQQPRIFEDVPRGAWEYATLHKIENLGLGKMYVSHDSQLLTRYEFGVLTLRIKNEVERKSAYKGRTARELKKLTGTLLHEFAPEIKAIEETKPVKYPG